MKIITLAGLSCWCPITIVLILLGLPIPTHASPAVLNPQQYINGTVTDTDGFALSGVNILIKDVPMGSISDTRGRYAIEAKATDVLVFSFIGYKTVEVPVNGRAVIDIQLEEEVTSLEGVVINAGYYTVKEKEKTGSISRITAQEIEKQPVSNPLQAMQGRMPGVYIQQNTGVPGGSFSIQVRGRNSIAAGNNPLYVIDGVPYTSGALGAAFSNVITGLGNPLSSINPADIESIEVLKDADATAIYGSRGANGVVLITTKKGKEGKASLDINLQSGTGRVTRTLDMLGTGEYLDMRREAFANDGVEPTTATAPDLLLWDTDRYTNWQEELVGNTAFITDLQASVSGGNAQTSFRFGGGVRKETTVFEGDFDYKKAAAHLNLNHTGADGKFSAVLSVNYVTENNTQPRTDPMLIALYTPPNAPEVYDDNGRLNWEQGTFSNPFSYMLQYYKSQTETQISNVVLRYRLARGLHLKTSAGYTSIQNDQLSVSPLASKNPAFNESGESWFGNVKNRSWIIEPQLTYEKALGQGKLSALLGASFQENRREGEEFYAYGFANDALLENMAAASSLTLQDISETRYRYHAVFGRLNYNHKGKYFLNITGRRDGSSRFGPGRQWANFGALGLAWIFSEEHFFSKALPFINYGKLRGSYGTTGNDRIGDYGYLDSWSSGFYTYNGASGLYPTRLFNPGYGWEVNKKLEVALELGFMDNRMEFTAGYYRNRSSSQLVGYPLPPTTGFTSIQDNLPAKVQNTGVELEFRTVPVQTEHLTWKNTVLLTVPRNKLLAFPGLENSAYANAYVVGEPLNITRVYHYTGVDPQTGIYTFEDVNGDGMISAPEDQQAVKRLGRDFFGSLGNQLEYNGWSFDVLLEFVRQTGYNYFRTIGSAPGWLRNQPVEVVNRWRQPGDETDIQRYTRGGEASVAYTNLQNSDRSIGDASFIRLRNISLSYRLPEKWTEHLGLNQCRFYVQGQNLLTFTKYRGLDPENQTTNSLPPLKIVTGGVQLTF